MSSTKRPATPRTIRRIAARRVFQSASGRPVVLTIGVPQPVPGWDWDCAFRITGLKTAWRRPRYVFGVDAIQALHLAMKHAGVILESTKPKLAWLGKKGNLGMPRFLPDLPKREQDRMKKQLSTTLTIASERRLVDQTGARWNRLKAWLRSISVLQRAC